MKLAQAYGYCWGVERAVQMAYEARRQYPERKMHITNEIIHNPAVNQVRAAGCAMPVVHNIFVNGGDKPPNGCCDDQSRCSRMLRFGCSGIILDT